MDIRDPPWAQANFRDPLPPRMPHGLSPPFSSALTYGNTPQSSHTITISHQTHCGAHPRPRESHALSEVCKHYRRADKAEN